MPGLSSKRAAKRRVGGFLVRRALPGLLAILFVAGCSGAEPGQETEASNRPNVIFVLADDLDYASAQKMPGLRSSLMEEGTSFEKTFVSHPLCCPSRSTILTGLYDHNHDVIGNNPPSGGYKKFLSEGLEEDTIAVRLQEGGYKTAFFGKYLNGYPGDDVTHVPPGWDEWYGKERGQRLYNYDINENGEVASYGNETEDFFTDVLSGKATDFVERAAPEEQPFFMYVAPTAPHGPATPAERHKGAFADEEAPRSPSFNEEDVSDKPAPIENSQPLSEEKISSIDERYQRRLESMLAVDEMVTALVEDLEAAGELENTFIFFTSDNGFFQGEHRIPGGKNRIYEESARVPLFVRGPDVPAGAMAENLVLNTDYAPTFAELAGVEFPADGRSLSALLRGEEPSWRSAILLEKLSQDRSGVKGKTKNKDEAENKVKGKGKAKSKDGTENKKKGKAKNKDGARNKEKGKVGRGTPAAFEAIRTETHKYVEYDNGERELYDLTADPYELENVYETADSSLVEDLGARLDALESCSEDGCREAEDAS